MNLTNVSAKEYIKNVVCKRQILYKPTLSP